MIEIFLAGGPVMYPLSLCSVLALAAILRQTLVWARVQRGRRPDLVARLLQEPTPREPGCPPSPDIVARVLMDGSRHPPTEAGVHMRGYAHTEMQAVERGVGIIRALVTLTPLLGIFGTVLGIVESFQLLGSAQLLDPTVASGGLAKALITTAFGLAIAMISFVAHCIFQTKALALWQELEHRCNQLQARLYATGGS
ncbi:MAG: MotA/TolQ/ExbB proton channel family protein [Gammaproteobacteria bacterium]|nr:MotA/TolQ/ExbB proton channel family protein [Gammaproteobacteria bacterium]